MSSQVENLFSHNLLLLLTCFRFPAPYGRKCHSGYSLMGLTGFQFSVMLSSWERASLSSVVAHWNSINPSVAPTVLFKSVLLSVFRRNGNQKQPASSKEPTLGQFIKLFWIMGGRWLRTFLMYLPLTETTLPAVIPIVSLGRLWTMIDDFVLKLWPNWQNLNKYASHNRNHWIERSYFIY